MDNVTVARILDEIGDLLEIKGENPFRVRAYRTAAETIANSPTPVTEASEQDLLQLPGIGKDLAQKVREIADTGDTSYHRELLQLFPPTLLELLHLQGMGPKTVALVHSALNVCTLEDLETAARSGALRKLKGLGPKKEQLILKALEERKQHTGRHLLADAHDAASALLSYLRALEPDAEFIAVGSVRRGCETCGDLDILAVGGTPSVLERFTKYRLVERILGRGDTKASVLVRGGYQADLRLVPPESRGAAMQYFTGSKAHNIALRDRAQRRGLKLNEYGLFRLDSGETVAGRDEAGIYAALDLAFVPPELRELRGEIEAAEAGRLPRLVEREDLRGDLHCHTNATDGRDDIETMAMAARDAKLSYLAITDHSQALAMAGGLDEHAVLEQAARVREIGQRLDGISLLAGIECDILPDGRLDLADDCLAQLDVVVASVHSAFNMEPERMTERVLRALESPWVDILAHPTGRLLLKRDAYALDIEQVITAAARHGVALEISSQIDRLDLNDANARLAHDRGATLVIDSDAHSRRGFGVLPWGVRVARRAWLTAADILNTRPLDEFLPRLRRARTGAP